MDKYNINLFVFELNLKNDKRIAKRNSNCTMGCCHHLKNKRLGILYQRKLYLCEYQKEKNAPLNV